MQDPLVKNNLLSAKDEKTGTELTLAPPPFMTPYLRETGGKLSFPPRFGQNNQALYGDILGRTAEELEQMKERGII